MDGVGAAYLHEAQGSVAVPMSIRSLPAEAGLSVL
jgi:hypothetical protein